MSQDVFYRVSPSAMERAESCPASVALGKNSARIEAGEAAAEGQLLHEACETENTDGLKPAQKILVKEALEEVARYTEDCIKDLREVWMDLYGPGNAKYSAGKADRLVVNDDIVTVIDYKFGRSPVLNPRENRQIQTYAVMASHKYERKRVQVVIIQPRIGWPEVTTFEDTMEFYRDIVGIVRHANSPEGMQEFHPTEDNCKYCPGRLNCEALKAWQDSVPACSMKALTDEEMRDFYGKAKVVKDRCDLILKTFKERAIKRRDAGSPIPGVKVSTRRGRRYVTDAQKCFDRVQAFIGLEEFMDDHVKVRSLSNLENAYIYHEIEKAKEREDDDVPTKKALKEEFAELMGNLIHRGKDTLIVKVEE